MVNFIVSVLKKDAYYSTNKMMASELV